MACTYDLQSSTPSKTKSHWYCSSGVSPYKLLSLAKYLKMELVCAMCITEPLSRSTETIGTWPKGEIFLSSYSFLTVPNHCSRVKRSSWFHNKNCVKKQCQTATYGICCTRFFKEQAQCFCFAANIEISQDYHVWFLLCALWNKPERQLAAKTKVDNVNKI